MAFPDTLLSNQWGADTDPPSFIAPSTMNTRVDTNLNALATRLQVNGTSDFITFVPGSTLTSAASGTATWATIGNLTVPTWATKARMTLSMSGISGTAGTSQAIATLKLGTVSGVGRRVSAPGVTNRFSQTFSDLLTPIATGVQSLTVQMTFVASTFSADVSSTFDVAVDYLA